jgi:hypothetical protein
MLPRRFVVEVNKGIIPVLYEMFDHVAHYVTYYHHVYVVPGHTTLRQGIYFTTLYQSNIWVVGHSCIAVVYARKTLQMSITRCIFLISLILLIISTNVKQSVFMCVVAPVAEVQPSNKSYFLVYYY